jgi:hypothetical protein
METATTDAINSNAQALAMTCLMRMARRFDMMRLQTTTRTLRAGRQPGKRFVAGG